MRGEEKQNRTGSRGKEKRMNTQLTHTDTAQIQL
jgi:hypothetical protein